MKLVLRLLSTAIVAVGAVATVHFATPMLYASVPAPRVGGLDPSLALGSVGGAPHAARPAAGEDVPPLSSGSTAWNRPTWFPPAWMTSTPSP